MPYRRSEKAIPLALAFGAYLLALLQKPGWASSDTKIDLHVHPAQFLADVASVWSPTVGLGHVQGGQYGGYLWPMGPFFALGHAIGLAPWLVQRLWLGTLLALGAWGVVRLLDALRGRPRGAAHVVAAVLFTVNPYVVVFANRSTFTLMAYAALPWLLLCVHRGLRSDRPWWWAAAFALILTSTGPGLNAAVWAWILPGPILLLAYERIVNRVRLRRFVLRLAAASVAASIWWIVPVVVQARYGVNFLQFSEQVGAIWSSSSLPEVLRLMGYWPSYLGVGYGDKLGPYFGTSPTMLFDLPTVVASLVIPGLALAGLVWTRRWRYGPYFLVLALVGLLAMSAGFPDGTPLRKAAVVTYDHVQAVQFLRTTNKAGPLVALAIACLGGVAAAELLRRVRLRALVVAVGALLVVLAALPLFKGQAVGLTWKRIPAAWTNAAAGLDRELPRNTRAAVIPDQEFGFYRWGGTVDPILPALTERPVAVRVEPPYDDMHAIDLLWNVEGAFQQRRLLPGALSPLLDLMNVGAVVSASDDDTGRSGGMPPAEAAAELARQGLTTPSRSYGTVRRYDRGASPGIVRVEPVAHDRVVDGSAQGLVDLAGLREPRPDGALRYAGDLSAPELRAEARRGADFVISDSNRRRTFLASRSRQNYGWTLPADVAPPSDGASLDPFGGGSDAQTVAVYRGARYVKAPFSAQLAQFADHRPYAAFDGDPTTSWLADPILTEPDQWVEIGFDTPHAVPYLDLLPDSSNPRYAVTQVEIAGRRFAVHPGWNHLRLGLGPVPSLRVGISGHRSEGANAGGAGGFSELRIPGVHVRELLRPPVLTERALAGADLGRDSLSYLFERTTADDPFRRERTPPPPPRSGNRQEAEAGLIRAARDPERGIDRVFSPPAARTWRIDGWATVSPAASDSALDRLVGVRGSFSSSDRYEGRPGYRASSAFDGDPARPWAAPWNGRPEWLAWHTARPRAIRELTLLPPRGSLRLPARVRVRADAGARVSPPLAVGPGGRVSLPQPLRGRSFRLDVLAAQPGTAPAVGIGELRGAGVPRAHVPRTGPLDAPCSSMTATGSGWRLGLRPRGDLRQFDGGEPLRMTSCGAPARLAAGTQDLHAAGALFRPLVLRLSSPRPLPAPVASGAVEAPGNAGRGDYSGVRVRVSAPSWLVLGESYNRGWHATCNGRDLGGPRVVDGFANGWLVRPGCRDVAFRFGPQRIVTVGYVIGALACLALLALLVLRRPRRRVCEPAPEPLPALDERLRLPARRALVVGLAAAAVFGFVFALRAGVVAGPAVALILWRGTSARRLFLGAGVLLALVVPLLYALFPGDDRGGYDTRYAVEHLGAHWVAVAAFVLLMLALAAQGQALLEHRRAERHAQPQRQARAPGDPAAGSAR